VVRVWVVGKRGKLWRVCRDVSISDGIQADLGPNGEPAPCQKELLRRIISCFVSLTHVSVDGVVLIGTEAMSQSANVMRTV
jgi:hypothetical protein